MCYEKRICVIKLQKEYFYTAFVRRRGFLWRGRWKELTPIMQPSYDDALNLTNDYEN